MLVWLWLPDSLPSCLQAQGAVVFLRQKVEEWSLLCHAHFHVAHVTPSSTSASQLFPAKSVSVKNPSINCSDGGSISGAGGWKLVSSNRLAQDPDLASSVLWPAIPSLSVALCRLACTTTYTADIPVHSLVAGQSGSAIASDVADADHDAITYPVDQTAEVMDSAARTVRKTDRARLPAGGRVAELVVCRAAAFMLGLGGVQALVEAARRDPEVRYWE